MVAYTTTYNLKKPTVADDEDVWGGYLNDSMDIIDDVLDGTVPVTGIDINSGTIDGTVIGGTTPADGTFNVLTATTSLGVTGNITVSGTVDGRDVSADGAKLDGIEAGATADQTKADIDALSIAASTAATLATARNIALSGDVSGSANFDGSADINITATVADDSHNHVISNVDGLQTALDAKLNSSSYTAADVLTKIKTVDGSGSGLDADTLDGLSSGSFLRSDAADSFSGTQTFTTNGGVMFRSGGDGSSDTTLARMNANATTNDSADYGFTIKYMGSRSGNDNSFSIFSDNGTAGSQVEAFRINQDGALLNNGNTIWTSGNDGSGSGLDADTLDGVQGSSYLRSDTNDSMSGALSISQSTAATATLSVTNSGGYSNNALIASFVGDSDSLQIRNHAAGDYRIVNSQQENGLSIMDGTGGVKLRYNGVDVAGCDSSGGFGVTSGNLTVANNANVTGTAFAGSLQEDYDALSGTTPTADADNGGAFSLTMTGNTTFTFGSVTSGRSVGFILQLTGNGGTVTWPASVDWAGGTAPDAPASGETDIYVFWTRDGGTTWYGVQSIDAAA